MEEVYKEKKVPVGQKVKEAIEIIKNHPGCTKRYVERALFSNGSRYYGEQIVACCLVSGVVIDASVNRRPMELYATPLSQEQMEAIATKQGCAVGDLSQWWMEAPGWQYRS